MSANIIHELCRFRRLEKLIQYSRHHHLGHHTANQDLNLTIKCEANIDSKKFHSLFLILNINQQSNTSRDKTAQCNKLVIQNSRFIADHDIKFIFCSTVRSVSVVIWIACISVPFYMQPASYNDWICKWHFLINRKFKVS